MYFESLKTIDKKEVKNLNDNVGTFITKRKIISAVILLLFLYSLKYIYSNLIDFQDFIYPGLRLIRQISIPFISLFPALTELYQETCLIQNPFFTVVDMDCWPCSAVNNIGQIYDPQPVHQQHAAPFIYKTDQQEIDIKLIKNVYLRNKEVFVKEPSKILVNNKYHKTPSQVFENEKEIEDSNLYIWKVNNINIARLIRQIVPRAKVVPKFGQSTERYIIIDSSHNTFSIPDTECNYAFLLALSGSRMITLNPAEECRHQCKSLKIELKESYLLWYNWWYWRPVVQKSNGNTSFLAHVGSYC